MAPHKSLAVVDYPMVPYVVQFPKVLSPGMSVKVEGVSHADKHFSINFKKGPKFDFNKNVMFHMDVRFKQVPWKMNSVVFNHKEGDIWQEQQVSDPSPFKLGQPFTIIVNVQADYYQVIVDGKQLATFKHHLPVGHADFMYITTDVDITKITID